MKNNFDESSGNGRRFVFIGDKLLPKAPVKKVDYILILIFIILVSVAGTFLVKGRASAGYVKNPVTKAVLGYKARSYIKDNYPDFREDSIVDTATGILKSSAGYTVRCHHRDDTTSRITVYFDRKFNITKAAVNLKSQT